MRINQNVAAFNAYRNLAVTTSSLGKSLEKLSSGFRINRAADDAAGLVKSESLRAEIGGTRQAVQNAQDGISFVQTAEGALNEVQGILQRMRDLAVSAANTATTDGASQQSEIDELVLELAAIGNRTTFAGQTVFANYGGGSATLVFHIGSGSGTNHQLGISDDLRITTADDVGIFSVTLDDVDVASSAETAISVLDSAIADVSDARATLGASQNRLEHTVANLNVALSRW
jgi:flagellin